jgi:hypothetical protein
MKRWRVLCVATLLAGAWGCASSVPGANPFLTLTEALGIATIVDGGTGGTTPGGQAATIPFRQPMTVSFRNNHSDAELNVSFAAWVNTSSVRSTEQRDALFDAGYTQLQREVRLGTAFTLPVGTLVYDGGGTAGATAVFLGPAQSDGGDAEPPTLTIELLSPDVILAFVQPPVSCDSVAFYYTKDGEPLTSVPVGGSTGPYAGATLSGAFKTLAQVDVYGCDPLRPGLFIRTGGGQRADNEYVEGQVVVFDYYAVPDANGNFCRVTITDVEE